MFYQNTIAAIATSGKNGSISVIRVSGEQSLEKVSEIFFDGKGTRTVIEWSGRNRDAIIPFFERRKMKNPIMLIFSYAEKIKF